MNRLELVPTVPRLFPAAEAVLRRPLYSHRSEEFSRVHRRVLENLRLIAGAPGVRPVIAAGTGTMANELMVWNFAPSARRVLNLANGEFGLRLAAQCRACRPDSLLLDFGWGNPFLESELEQCLRQHPEVDRIFAVAAETSCARENDLAMLDRIARKSNIQLALDAVSSFGTGAELFSFPSVAACSASSGKALAALPGIAILLCRAGIPPAAPGLPDSLDLAKLFAAQSSPGGVRNTLGSLPLETLDAALGELLNLGISRYRQRMLDHKALLTAGLAGFGVTPLPGSDSPMVSAFLRPPEPEWSVVSARLATHGIAVYDTPAYLREHGCFEVALMGDHRRDSVTRLLDAWQSAAELSLHTG